MEAVGERSEQGSGRAGTWAGEPPFELVMALAHGLDPALDLLQVTAHNPVQGEAMHKVLAYHGARALIAAGWEIHPPVVNRSADHA